MTGAMTAATRTIEATLYKGTTDVAAVQLTVNVAPNSAPTRYDSRGFAASVDTADPPPPDITEWNW